MPRPNVPKRLDALDWMAAVIIRPSLPPAMTSRTNVPARTQIFTGISHDEGSPKNKLDAHCNPIAI